MKYVKGCRHKPRCVRSTAGAMTKHHPSKELSKEAFEYGCKVFRRVNELREPQKD